MTQAFIIFATYLQNISLLFKQNIKYPHIIEAMRQVFLALLTLNFSQFPGLRDVEALQELLAYSRLEYRSRYVLLCIFIPLTLTVVMIALFKNYAIVFWYLGFLLCFALIEMSIIGFISKSGIVLSWGDDWNTGFMILAFVLACILMIFAFIYKLIRIHKGKRRRRKWKRAHREKLEAERLRRNEVEMKFQNMKGMGSKPYEAPDPDEQAFGAQENRKISLLSRLFSLLRKQFLKKLGIQMDFQIVESARKTALTYDAPRIVGHIVMGSVCIMFGIAAFILTLESVWVAPWFIIVAILGVVIIIYGLLLTTQPGRDIAYKIYRFIKKWGMRCFLLIMAMLYTPILSSIYFGLICYTQTCPEGTSFPSKNNMFSVETLAVGKTYMDTQDANICEYCSYYMPRNESLFPYYRDLSNNGSVCPFINEICPGGERRLLLEDPSIACSSIASYFYLPSTLLYILYVFGLPFIFFIITLKGVKLLELMRVDFLMDMNLPFDPKLRIQHRVRSWTREKLGLSSRQVGEQKDADQEDDHATNRSPEAIEANNRMFPIVSTKQQQRKFFGDQSFQVKNQNVRTDQHLAPGQRHALYNRFPLPEGIEPNSEDADLPDAPKRLFKVTYQNTENLPPIQRLKHHYVPSVTDIRLALGISKKTMQKKLQRKMFRLKQREQWKIRSALTNNPVKTVYADYRRNMRFFRLAIILYKVLNVSACTLLISTPWLAVSMSILCHTLALFILLITKPYSHRLEMSLAATGLILSVINSCYSFIHCFFSIQDYGAVVILILNSFMFLHTFFNLFTYLFVKDFNPNRYYWSRLRRVQRMAKEDPTLPVSYQFIKETKEHINNVDEMLAESTLKWVESFFMVLGVVCFMSFSLCFFGMFKGEFQTPFVTFLRGESLSSCAQVNQHEFVGYGNWNNFTANCCCESSSIYHDRLYNVVSGDTYDDVEMWTCRNGEKKERIRTQYLKERHSGLKYRPFCGTRFYDGVLLDDSDCVGGIRAHFESEETTSADIAQILW